MVQFLCNIFKLSSSCWKFQFAKTAVPHSSYHWLTFQAAAAMFSKGRHFRTEINPLVISSFKNRIYSFRVFFSGTYYKATYFSFRVRFHDEDLIECIVGSNTILLVASALSVTQIADSHWVCFHRIKTSHI